MKKMHILKAALLMITMAIFHTAPVYASQEIVGSVDLFNENMISGWVYETGAPVTFPEVQLRITNAQTGETVKELAVSPSYNRTDLSARLGEDSTPAFTAAVDLSFLPDGSYFAAAYKNGEQFSNTACYTKGGTASANAAASGQPLGTFRLTAYCPCKSCSEGWERHTSSGAIAQSNHTVAVDPRVIPMGSKLLIDGIIYTAEDIGGAVKGNHIDVFFDTHTQTRQFGSRSAEVYLIK